MANPVFGVSKRTSAISPLEEYWALQVCRAEGYAWHSDGLDGGGTIVGVTKRFHPRTYTALTTLVKQGRADLIDRQLVRFYVEQYLRPWVTRLPGAQGDLLLALMAEANLSVVSRNLVPSVGMTLSYWAGALNGGIAFVHAIDDEEQLVQKERLQNDTLYVMDVDDIAIDRRGGVLTSSINIYQDWRARPLPTKWLVTLSDTTGRVARDYAVGYGARLRNVLKQYHTLDLSAMRGRNSIETRLATLRKDAQKALSALPSQQENLLG